MAVDWLSLAVGLGTAVGQGVAGIWGAERQAEAAREASRRQEEIGREGAGIIDEATQAAIMQQEQAAAASQDYLAGGVEDLQTQQAQNVELFGTSTEAGDLAIEELKRLLLGGPGGGAAELAEDPAYQFRLSEGEKALDRAARAGGDFGSGAHVKDILRFSQGLASQEIDRVTARLMGLAGLGQQAAHSQAGFNTTLAGQLAAQSQAQSGAALSTGQLIGQLTQGGAIAQTNALLGTGTQSLEYALQQANAEAYGARALGSALSQGALIAAYGGQGGDPLSEAAAGSGGAPVTNPNAGITTPVPSPGGGGLGPAYQGPVAPPPLDVPAPSAPGDYLYGGTVPIA